MIYCINNGLPHWTSQLETSVILTYPSTVQRRRMQKSLFHAYEVWRILDFKSCSLTVPEVWVPLASILSSTWIHESQAKLLVSHLYVWLLFNHSILTHDPNRNYNLFIITASFYSWIYKPVSLISHYRF